MDDEKLERIVASVYYFLLCAEAGGILYVAALYDPRLIPVICMAAYFCGLKLVEIAIVPLKPIGWIAGFINEGFKDG